MFINKLKKKINSFITSIALLILNQLKTNITKNRKSYKKNPK